MNAFDAIDTSNTSKLPPGPPSGWESVGGKYRLFLDAPEAGVHLAGYISRVDVARCFTSLDDRPVAVASSVEGAREIVARLARRQAALPVARDAITLRDRLTETIAAIKAAVIKTPEAGKAFGVAVKTSMTRSVSPQQRWGEGDHHGLVESTSREERWTGLPSPISIGTPPGFLPPHRGAVVTVEEAEKAAALLPAYREEVEKAEDLLRRIESWAPPVFVNLTPHDLVVGSEVYPASGNVARVSATHTPIVDGFCRKQMGEVENLPPAQPGVFIIVSAMVFDATDRADVVAPATGHPAVVRNEKGHIVSVPCFLKH